MAEEGLTGVVELLDEDVAEAPGIVAEDRGTTTDLVRLYLNDAGRHALLDKENEADLAKRYQAGLAADQLLASGGRLTARRRALLQRASRDGRQAKERMVQANLRLVVPQARKHVGRGLDLLELIQEGNLGLLRAVEKFDHTKGYKFSTYGVWWIRQALQRGLASKGRTIRVPVHVGELYGKVRAAELLLCQHNGVDPSEEEVAAEIGLSVERVREVRESMQELVSLDRPIGEEGEATMGDVIPDLGVVDPAETVAQDDAISRIDAVLSELGERERTVLVLRFGLGGQPPQTFEEIGQQLGVTRERVRQMQQRALDRLRHPSRAHHLDGLLAAYGQAA